jgi:hypothetical protein
VLAALRSPDAPRLVAPPIRLSVDRWSLASVVAAVAVVALVAAQLLGRSENPPVAATPPPVVPATASPSASAPSSQTEANSRLARLQFRWVGVPRDVPGLGTSPLTELVFDAEHLHVEGSTYPGVPFLSTIETLGAATIGIRAPTGSTDCAVGDLGAYPWSLSPSGVTLTIGPGSDPCAARSVALPGTWYREQCDSGNCLGPLEAGTYPSHNIDPRLTVDRLGLWQPAFGALSYTVPDGWTNPADNPSRFWLMPTVDYERLATDTSPLTKDFSIYVFPRPAAVTPDRECWSVDPRVGRTPEALVDAAASHPGIEGDDRGSIEIDGHAGAWIDVRLRTKWTGSCPDWTDRPVPDAQLFMDESGNRDEWGAVGPFGSQRMRLIVLDLGDGASVLIVLVADDAERFPELVSRAMPIVQSFRFR